MTIAKQQSSIATPNDDLIVSPSIDFGAAPPFASRTNRCANRPIDGERFNAKNGQHMAASKVKQ
jgi:hypothetical protein